MSKENEIFRRDEIINACEKLYSQISFKEISLKLISEETTFSRPSIYNYFNSKEEIFLALATREYEKWIEDLTNIFNKSKMSKKDFSNVLAHSLEKRVCLLKLISTNLNDMEENSRIEYITAFKASYGKSMEIVRSCLLKFFEDITNKEVNKFIYTFFPFMIGIYPYAVVTDKKKEAMKKANISFNYYSVYEIANMGISRMLGV